MAIGNCCELGEMGKGVRVTINRDDGGVMGTGNYAEFG